MCNTIQINLYQDWIRILREKLIEFGYDESSYDDKGVIHTYLNLTKRLIPQKPREPLKSTDFFCPTNVLTGLNLIEEKIKKGEDLTPYLSKNINRPDYNDDLLNDWGIHHLHLGTTIGSDGFAKRTGLLLFCRFDEEKAYLINVLPHGSWTEQDMIKALHENWPTSIQNFRMHNAIQLSNNVSNQDIKELRGSNINSCIETEDGTIYGPIGGGFASSGISTEVVIKASIYEKLLTQRQNEIIRALQEDTRKNTKKPKSQSFSLKVSQNKMYAVENNGTTEIDLEITHP